MSGEVLLWSFQPLHRVADLESDGELAGSWEHVPPSSGDVVLAAYREMVAAMARAGVDTEGRPPVWAWGGQRVTVQDAHSLVGGPVWDGYATIEFAAPSELVVATDYHAWNDYLADLFTAGADALRTWEVLPSVGAELVQVCLPVLRKHWVREIRPLPRSEVEAGDWFGPA